MATEASDMEATVAWLMCSSTIRNGRQARIIDMSIVDTAAVAAISRAEARSIPDSAIRLGMKAIIASRLASEAKLDPAVRQAFWDDAWKGPIAVATDDANEQHYEVPAAYFDLVLGPRRKYSSGYWSEGVSDLASAEEAMLDLYAERAELADGQRVLDLGCGWGSLSLRAAEQYPGSRVVAVSNSAPQREFIESTAAERGLDNIEVITSDINDFAPEGRFDRIVSVEMLEHVRNHRALFGRMRAWIEEDGALFVHVFGHREHAYPFETEGRGAWMAQTFFTGGVMPSPDLLPEAAIADFALDHTWWINGGHYARTLRAWLDLQDLREPEVRRVLAPVYGSEVELWIQRWRMFFMACEEMFAFDDGKQWGVLHQLFRPLGG